MKNLVKVKDHPHLYRDENSGAIINYDTIGYNQRLKRKEKQKSDREELDEMKKDIEEIKVFTKRFFEKIIAYINHINIFRIIIYKNNGSLCI